MPPKFKRNIQCILLRNKKRSSIIHTYGTITLYGTAIPSKFQLNKKKIKIKSETPHLPYLTIWDSVCPTSFSLAVTNDIAIAFSSSTY